MRRGNVSFDMLASWPARAILRSPLFPVILQVGSLAVVLLLVVNGFGFGLGMRAE